MLAGMLALVFLSRGAHAEPFTVPAKSYGPEFTLPQRPALPDDPSAPPQVTEYDLSLGCIVGGLAGTGASVGVGGINVVNLIAGGLVSAATPAAAYLALGGVVFASFCAVGQAVTPAVMASYAYFVPGPNGSPSPQMEARYCSVSAPLSAAAPLERPAWLIVSRP